MLVLFSLALVVATSFGKITLNIPDHIIVEQQTVIPWTRSAEDKVFNPAMRTVPSINFEPGALQTDSKAGLSGTVTVVFHESPSGFVSLEVFDKDNPNNVYITSSPFSIFNVDGTTGPQGAGGSTAGAGAGAGAGTQSGVGSGAGSDSGSGSGSGTSDTTANSSTDQNIASSTDSSSSDTPEAPATPISSPNTGTTATFGQGVGATSLSQSVTFTTTTETFFSDDPTDTASPGADSTAAPVAATSKRKTNTAAIAGGIIGGIAALIILGALLRLRHRRLHKGDGDSPTFNRDMMVRKREYNPSFFPDKDYRPVDSV